MRQNPVGELRVPIGHNIFEENITAHVAAGPLHQEYVTYVMEPRRQNFLTHVYAQSSHDPFHLVSRRSIDVQGDVAAESRWREAFFLDQDGGQREGLIRKVRKSIFNDLFARFGTEESDLSLVDRVLNQFTRDKGCELELQNTPKPEILLIQEDEK